MPEVDIRLQPVVFEQAETLERLQEGARGDPQGRFDLNTLLVVCQLPGLSNRIDEVGRGDLLPVVEWRLEVLAIVVGDFAHRGNAGANRCPGICCGIPKQSIFGNLEGALRPGRLGLERGAERNWKSTKGVADNRRVDQILVDVTRVGVAEATDRIPDRAIGPDPEITNPNFL